MGRAPGRGGPLVKGGPCVHEGESACRPVAFAKCSAPFVPRWGGTYKKYISKEHIRISPLFARGQPEGPSVRLTGAGLGTPGYGADEEGRGLHRGDGALWGALFP